VLATDGDLIVGITGPDELQGFVERQRGEGIQLSVLDFGPGNHNDLLLQRLAQHGDGQAFHIDSLAEARRVLVEGLTGTPATIARDVKVQLELNPAEEVGAGHMVTSLYEFAPADSGAERIEPRRYGAPASTTGQGRQPSAEIGFLKLRYRLPGGTESRLIERPITTAVAAFG
jgi:Ca-activated chloride channel homolog